MPLNPLLAQKLPNVSPDVGLSVVIETPPSALSETLAKLSQIGIDASDVAFSQFILASMVPAGIVAELGNLDPDIVVHYNMPKSVISAFVSQLLPGVNLSMMDPLLGEFRVDKTVVPGPKPLGVPSFPSLTTFDVPNTKITPTGLSKAVIVDIGTNLTGKGVLLAVIDTGCTPFHPQLLGRNVDLESVVPELPFDMMGHGQWCSCAAAGGAFDTRFGRVEGIAPGVNLLHVKALSTSGMGTTFGILKAMELAYNKGAKVVSMSLGGDIQGSIFDDPEIKVVESLSQTGMIFVIAAGNSGPGPYSIGSPGAAPSAVTVGSFSLLDAPAVAYFSSRGPQGSYYMGKDDDLKQAFLAYGDDIYKPDLVAPGGGRADANSLPDEVLYSGCLTDDTPVYTPDGPIPIENVREGERVYSIDGGNITINKCLANIDKGEKDIVDIIASGCHVRATPDHRFLSVEYLNDGYGRWKRAGLVWKEAQELSQGDVLLLSRKLPENVEPEIVSIISKERARWLGYFVGDGWLRLDRKTSEYRLGISTTNGEDDYVRLFKEAFGLDMHFDRSNNSYYLNHKRLALALKLLGVGEPHDAIDLPRWLFHLPHDVAKEFLLGYIDADGGHEKRNVKRMSFGTASLNLAQGIRALAHYLGWTSSNIYTKQGYGDLPGYNNRLYTMHQLSITPGAPVGNQTFTQQLLFDQEYFRMARVRDIRLKGTAHVRDLDIEGSHNFIADGIMTHNCTGWFDGYYDLTPLDGFEAMHGTSQATPAVAGLVSMLVEGGIVKSSADVKRYMQKNGHPKSYDDGYGLIRLSYFAPQ